ncbi:MAG TPA: twin-arginine translocase TatA/TatE family subunit [Thermodesulfovibrionales bacterium]|nr:twin-arginine translocase TatA/TatE family subunit [Thermodesulfovibrionales bacterium]
MISGGEVIIILIVALIVFGPKRLPELGRALGKAMHELNRSMQDFKAQMEAESEEQRKDTKSEDDRVPEEKTMAGDKSDSKDRS